MNVLLLEPETVAVCRTVYFFDGEGHLDKNPPEEWYLYDSDDPVEFLINLYGGNGRAGMISANAYLTPRTVAEKVGGWDLSISPSPDEDGEYFCRVILASTGIRFVPSVYNYYRKHRAGRNLSNLRSPMLMQGALRSLELIAKHLLDVSDDVRAKQALAGHYLEYAYSAYPDYPDITEAALHHFRQLGGTSYKPLRGGWKVRTLCKLFGWRMARIISVKGRRVQAAMSKVR